MESEEALATRNTTTQPTEYVTEDGQIRYNKRKLTELPEFIVKLTPGLSIPLACKNIYLNYEFFHGQVVCCQHSDIFSILEKFCQSSSYSMNVESIKMLKELRFIQLLHLQCLLSICDYPHSMAAQFLSRALIFNGLLPYLTEFFIQSDKESPKHCALIVPYQSLPPPGMGSIFTIEKHSKPIYSTVVSKKSSIVYSLSNKIHAFNVNLFLTVGEIELPPLNEPEHYKQLIVMIYEESDSKIDNLKLANGVAIVFSDHCLHSTSLNSSQNFTKIFDNVKIKNIFLISPNHVLLFFDQSKYFEVYNCTSGQIVLNQNFSSNIKFVEICEKKESNFDKSFRMAIVLDNSEILFFIIKNEIKSGDKLGNEIFINSYFSLKSTGIDCVSCNLLDGEKGNRETSFFLSFKDGSFIFIYCKRNEERADKFECLCMKPNLNETNKNGTPIQFQFLDLFENRFLLLGENKIIYLLQIEYSNSKDKAHLIKVSGYYTNGYFVKKNLVVATENGKTIFVKQIQFNLIR